MVDRYIEKLKAVEQVPAKTVWIGRIIPAAINPANNHWWSLTTGTWEQRQQRVDWINQRLKMHCEKEGYLFMDFSEGYTNPRGDLDMKMTDGNHHLLYWTEKQRMNTLQDSLSITIVFVDINSPKTDRRASINSSI